jgi:hypothetical protein
VDAANATEIENLVAQHLPEAAQRGFIRAVFDARRVSNELARQEHADPEADNSEPWEMRAKLQGHMRGIAEITPGLSAVTVKSGGTWWNHVEVCAGPLVITAHSVSVPCGPLPSSKYQLTLASDNQLALFDDARRPTKLYAMLLHSRYRGRNPQDSRLFGHLPGSLYLAFPFSDMKGYAHRVDLFERYPALVNELLPREWANEARVYYRWQASHRAVA